MDNQECLNSMHTVEKIPNIISQLYDIVAQLEDMFPGRRFTPDGHLIGSIGEVMAAHRYDLKLLPHSFQGHDARTSSGKLVEIKITQGKYIALREQPEHLIVLHLSKIGEALEIYNGLGILAWESAGAMQRNGQRSISLSKLHRLMAQVSNESRIPERFS